MTVQSLSPLRRIVQRSEHQEKVVTPIIGALGKSPEDVVWRQAVNDRSPLLATVALGATRVSVDPESLCLYIHAACDCGERYDFHTPADAATFAAKLYERLPELPNVCMCPIPLDNFEAWRALKALASLGTSPPRIWSRERVMFDFLTAELRNQRKRTARVMSIGGVPASKPVTVHLDYQRLMIAYSNDYGWLRATWTYPRAAWDPVWDSMLSQT